MENNIKIGLLYEFYNKLLTERQSYILDSYYNNDLSLSEISDELKITRQGVRKHIKDAERLLNNYEDKLGLLEKYISNKKEIDDICIDLKKLQDEYNDKTLEELRNRINKLI